MTDYANLDDVVREAMGAWRPPPRLTLSQWADQHFRLSVESAAEPGRWRTLPYQRGWMDAITDPRVTHVTVMKSARVGYTKALNAAVGYYIHHEPCALLVVQPTVEDAEGYSKEEIAPMLRDCPVLNQIMFEEAEEVGPREGGNSMRHKKFPGGLLSLVGANSGAGLRRISRRAVFFDEVDAYPLSAGADGDPIELGKMRTQTFWNRKIVCGSTPLVAGTSRIEALFEQGDQRRYYVPCPQCGHMAPFVFSGDTGHSMHWPEGDPAGAHFVCQANGCIIEPGDKFTMIERGEWRAAKPFDDAEGKGHASFHIWAAYSYTATWMEIVGEFLAIKDKPDKFRTFVNTWLGETWKERGEAPDWDRLHRRREGYTVGQVPEGVEFLTAGVDVQKDRWVYEVVGWGKGKESWSIDASVISGDTANEAAWVALDSLLTRSYPTETGGAMEILCLAVDSGYQTQQAYNWARRWPMSRVIATKGVDRARTIINQPSPVDINVSGRRLSRGYSVWPVGSSVAKSELYGFLRLPAPGPGYCHFPAYGEEYFKELTAEQLVSRLDRRKFTRYEWEVIPGRQNHFLDCRVGARAAAARLGLDRARPAAPPAPAKPSPAPAPLAPASRPKSGGFLSRPGRGGKGWLR